MALDLPRPVHRALLRLWRLLAASPAVRRRLERLVNPSFLVGVLGVVEDGDGRVLLAHHTYRRKHAWGFPGGWLHAGEDPARALVRELREETGLEATPLRLLGVRHSRRPKLTLVYTLRVTGGTFRPSDEVDAIRYVPIADVVAELHEPGWREILAQLGWSTSSPTA